MSCGEKDNVKTQGNELLYEDDVLGKICCLFLATALLVVSGQILIYLLLATPAPGEGTSMSSSEGAAVSSAFNT